ncbi:MAG: hypothetical protein QGH83_04930 [Candidatus Pacebacteria bacterium]|jgi:hypothetical protein|nr:hypothetical protein [Candidatus Paceibacterota bacterium]
MAQLNEGLLDKLKTAIKTSKAGAKARAAGDWFKEKIKQAGASARMRAVTPNQLLKRQPEDNIMLGKMFFYKYDPKWAKKLPYWDMYPLVFPFEKAPGGFYGLNLHYIPPRDRAILMDSLNQYANNDKYDKTTRLQLSYQLLKKYGRAVPCVKRYLGDHVVSQTVRVDADEWEIAIFLPVERFQKESKNTVWKDSRRHF